MLFHEAFPKLYEVEINPDLPSGEEGRIFRFPPDRSAARFSALVRVCPHGGYVWWGVFTGDYPGATWGVFTCPSAHQICIVVAGCGYLVDSTSPERWEEVVAYPITRVVQLVEEGLLLFLDFSEAAAYGVGGLRWRTKELGFDGFETVELQAGRLVLKGWREGQIDFASVDIFSGKVMSTG